MAVVLAGGPGEQKAACERIGEKLFAFGVLPATTVWLSKSIVAESQKQLEEASRRVNVLRGMTGQVFTAVQCKPSTTVLQVKHDIFVKTGVPIAEQQLLGFGSSHVLEDEVKIGAVPMVTDCGGLQIIVDAPKQTHKPWESISEDVSSDEESLSLAEHDDFTSIGSGDGKASSMAMRRRNLAAGALPRPGGRAAHERLRFGAPGAAQAATPVFAAARGAGGGNGGSCGGTRGAKVGSGKGRGRGNTEVGGSSTKLQRHFILCRELQELDFDVLGRAKPRTKVIWQQTGVSLRLHGPGSGQQEDEEELVLSLSAKQCDCNRQSFAEAVRLAEELIRSLNEQYCRFCVQRWRAVPDLGLRTQHGYRKGSHKIR